VSCFVQAEKMQRFNPRPKLSFSWQFDVSRGRDATLCLPRLISSSEQRLEFFEWVGWSHERIRAGVPVIEANSIKELISEIIKQLYLLHSCNTDA
jgi:hypothetical protein